MLVMGFAEREIQNGASHGNPSGGRFLVSLICGVAQVKVHPLRRSGLGQRFRERRSKDGNLLITERSSVIRLAGIQAVHEITSFPGANTAQ
jgi:hypothetical protein